MIMKYLNAPGIYEDVLQLKGSASMSFHYLRLQM